jgi:hypothetical protein
MKRSVALLALLALFSCGKKGPVLAPLIKAPKPVEAVKLTQRGESVFVEWKNPVGYMDGTALAAAPLVEIWVLEQPKAAPPAAKEAVKKPQGEPGPAQAARPGEPPKAGTPPGGHPNPSAKLAGKDFESRGKLAISLAKDKLAGFLKEKGAEAAGYSYPFPLEGKKLGAIRLAFALRVKDARSRTSEFSDPVSIEPRIVSQPPGSLEVRAVEGGVELAWSVPAANTDGSSPPAVAGYNIYVQRPGAGGPAVRLNAKPVNELKYVDGKAEYGVPLRYFVRATASEAEPYFESLDSVVRDITAGDVFPPAAPSGAIPVIGRGFIALSWDANKEKDLVGYLVRRGGEDGTGEGLLTPLPIRENTFTDSTVERGRRYRYSISAVDAAGNESPKTEITAESLKDIPQ